MGEFWAPGAKIWLFKKKNMDRSIDLAVQHKRSQWPHCIWICVCFFLYLFICIFACACVFNCNWRLCVYLCLSGECSVDCERDKLTETCPHCGFMRGYYPSLRLQYSSNILPFISFVITKILQIVLLKHYCHSLWLVPNNFCQHN